MKRFEKFLFFYSIIAVTVFAISYGIYSPKPLNLVSVGLMTPVIFYFWIRLTSPESTNPDRWGFRFLAAVVLVSLLGLTGYWLSFKSPPTSNSKSEENIPATSIVSTPTAIPTPLPSPGPGDESVTDILYGTPVPDSTVSGQIQRIKARPGISKVDIYQNPSSTSPKIGSIDTSITYPYLEKQGTWYKIIFSGTTSGWVNSSQVEEVY